MNNQDMLMTLAIRVGQMRPNIDPIAISKAITKIHKLAITVRKRTIYPMDGEAFPVITRGFIQKAEKLADEIGCELRIDDGLSFLLCINRVVLGLL